MKETVQICAVVLALITAILGLYRELSKKEKINDDSSASSIARYNRLSASRRWLPVPFLWREEVAPIFLAGILMNFLGLSLAVRMKSILYLDMTGTAFVSFFLGPWWGALTGLVSNSVVNVLTYPEPNGNQIIFPWSLVNMAGGIYWGVVARHLRFLRTPEDNVLGWRTQLSFALFYGVIPSAVLAIIATAIRTALKAEVVLALDPKVATALDNLLVGLTDRIRPGMTELFGDEFGGWLAWALPDCIQHWIRYIPDKTLSAAFALLVIRQFFPIYRQQLCRRVESDGVADNWTGPVLLGCVYFPSFLVLVLGKHHNGGTYWPIWASPWVVFFIGMFRALQQRHHIQASLACLEQRQLAYSGMLDNGGKRPMLVAILASSLLVFVGLIPLRIASTKVMFNFFCVVGTLVLTAWILRVATWQNCAAAVSESSPPGTLRIRSDDRDIL